MNPAYVPALRLRLLTRFYEPIVRMTMRDDAMKTLLASRLTLRTGVRVADIGCGPGGLAARIAKSHPGVEVVGVDGDPEVLRIAEAKREGLPNLRFISGLATSPPLEAGAFDRVVMSLVLHHLATEDKVRALRAARALLRPDGELHVVDWVEGRTLAMRAAFLSIRLLDGFANTRDHARGLLRRRIEEAGFDVEETDRERTIYGVVGFLRARRTRD